MDKFDSIFGATPANGPIAQRAEAAALPPPPAPPSRPAGAAPAPTTPMLALAQLVMRAFRENWEYRSSSGVSDRLDYALLVNRMRFSPKQMEALAAQFGAESDLPRRIRSCVTAVGNRKARSILVDLVNQAGEPLFHFEPTPVPDVGEQERMKVLRRNALKAASLLDGLERQGVTPDTMPPEALEELRSLIEGTFERRYDDARNDLEEEARDRVRRMERKVWDILEEGGFNGEFLDFLTNICVTGTGVMVGPVMRNVARNAVVERRGSKTYRREVRCIPVFESVNPLDCYPAPGALDVEDGPLCITVKYSGAELFRFASSARSSEGEGDVGGGWIGTEVNALLRRHADGGGVKLNAVAFDFTRRECENNGFDDTNDGSFEGVRCFMPVRGSVLAEMGIVEDLDGGRIASEAFYRTETIVIDNRVVYVCIHPDELGVPVSKAVFYKLPGSWWGGSIAEMLQQCQCVLDNTAKSILLNESMCSSPMGYITDVSRLNDKSPNALKFRAGKIFPFSQPMGYGGGNAGAPIGVLPVPSALEHLLAIWKAFQQQADLDSGLPAYSEGQAAGASGALRTAQGLNTFVENTMRGLKMVMTDIDQGGIARVARLTADWVLLYDKDQSIKGDVYVRSVGLIGRVLKVQRDAARLQLLNLCLNSELLTQSIGVGGIIELFRPSLVDLDINPDDILPSKADVEEQDALMKIARLIQAAGGANEPPPQATTGMQSGVSPVGEPPPAQPGGVAERRGAA